MSTAPDEGDDTQRPTPDSKVLSALRPFPTRGGVVTNAQIDTLREEDAY